MKRVVTLLVCGFLGAGLAAAQTVFYQEGTASWYGAEFAGRPTASGEIFDPTGFTAAHRELPFGTVVSVVNIDNGKQVFVRVNDRGPYVKTRIIDVSMAAAEHLGLIDKGIARVSVELAPQGSATGIVRFHGDNDRFNEDNDRYHGDNDRFNEDNDRYHGDNDRFNGDNDRFNEDNDRFNGDNDRFNGAPGLAGQGAGKLGNSRNRAESALTRAKGGA